MAITSRFIKATGQLETFGDAAGNTITMSRNAAGTILVNGGEDTQDLNAAAALAGAGFRATPYSAN